MNLYYNKDKSQAIVLEAVTNVYIVDMSYLKESSDTSVSVYTPSYFISLNMVGGGKVERFEHYDTREEAEAVVADIERAMKSSKDSYCKDNILLKGTIDDLMKEMLASKISRKADTRKNMVSLIVSLIETLLAWDELNG